MENIVTENPGTVEIAVPVSVPDISQLSPAALTEIKKIVGAWMHEGKSRGEIVALASAVAPLQNYSSLIIQQAFDALWDQGKLGGDRERYFKLNDGLFLGLHQNDLRDLRLIRLTNFTVSQIQQVISDDGTSTEVSHELLTVFQGKGKQISLTNDALHKMLWHIYSLGSGAVVFGRWAHDALVAMQMTAEHLPPRFVYTHTGWHKDQMLDESGDLVDAWYYLHARGSIDSV